jgi:putative colanic acid biosysnthesis UDP-glucose lipid carrier transferase
MSSAPERLVTQLASEYRSHLASAKRAATRTSIRVGTLDPGSVLLFRHLVNPLVVLATLAASMAFFEQSPTTPYMAAALVATLLTVQIVRPPNLDRWMAEPNTAHYSLLRTLFEWSIVVLIMVAVALAMHVQHLFPRGLLNTWIIATGANLAAAHWGSAQLARWLTLKSARTQRHIVVGINDVGIELVRRMKTRACASEFMGYFDFREPERLAGADLSELKGHANDVARYVREHGIQSVYLAVPISNASRIQELLSELRDTTASVYFVPDIFSFDLVQPRFVEVNGMPALSVTETPLQGLCGVRKRATDVSLAILAICVLWPVLLTIAVAVRLSSPGPVLFKQRRYGLHGEEILVFKFRTMTVCEDGANVIQAKRGDRRVTRLGKFLRRASLDELPQIFNVLCGHMSFVGPRPHAIAHNEQYRKLISGYMMRHKVRPGITGWAQVNGSRGETDTVEKMARRVRYDLDYLQHWSLWFDVRILITTLWKVIRRENAY